MPALHISPFNYIESFVVFFKKMGHPRPLFRLFLSFKQTLQFLLQIYVKKCPSSIRCRDLNPQPSDHESPPITTTPRLLLLTRQKFAKIMQLQQQRLFEQKTSSEASVTRWLDYFSFFGHLQQWKFICLRA